MDGKVWPISNLKKMKIKYKCFEVNFISIVDLFEKNTKECCQYAKAD